MDEGWSSPGLREVSTRQGIVAYCENSTLRIHSGIWHNALGFDRDLAWLNQELPIRMPLE
jgi:uncharacterized protein YfaT (DUF1175 family)